MASLPALSLPQPFTSSEVIAGRARAISGDRLVINGRTVRLRGIEAPEPGQTCRTARDRAWRCGAASRRELAEITGRAVIRCEAVADGGSQSMIGVCRKANADVAELMVQRGAAFAEAGLFSTYGQAEQAARRKKAGIWQGNAERPAAWRAARWAHAKDRAPDGCPIKGKVSRRGKFYVLPWSPAYRRARVRSHRGERWFCSEKEAIAAGWRPATAG
jgi:endonuclease YncB( thermonuclease family)